ncbi:hypothetical protein DW989_14520 [Bacteroides stercoris]|uniref:Uncharacterized protein n=1 Tax=Bacteroides stercoris TaxID=46506 RepID=A0A7J5LBD7_BACSE|nr:hypothetical protein F9953_10635 [Bacteroides stercoris]KAB5290151.1 hypothetical protein F9945_14615 [Bacteroides stercoris]KAB5296482.1 hypothetical protein F9955_14360 [Bacteroides stercoris]KAB5301204.1 hypothetical protein F9942_10270 [Bacteroides stercoris]KAB5301819.1 hypothetical protein F9991_11560 [Bacteroides stercoris]
MYQSNTRFGTRNTNRWYGSYQALVREVPHYGTRTTKRWYTEYQLPVAEVPPFGTRSTASRYRQITYSLIAPQCGQTPFAPIFCPQLPQR